jgi:hypothetical protein
MNSLQDRITQFLQSCCFIVRFGIVVVFDLPEAIPASQSEDELKTVNQRERFLVILDQFRRGLCWDNSLHRWNILVDELHFYSTG